MLDPETAKAVGQFAGTIEKVYDDLAHPVASELGKLFSMPLKIVNHYGDRLIEMMTKAKDAVPPERQLPAVTSIAGPIFENVKYLEEGNPLLSMYQKLLTQLIDSDGVMNVHPAFPKIIDQLSADEAFLLYKIKEATVLRVRSFKYPKPGSYVTTNQEDQSLLAALLYPQHAEAYFSRLLLMGLVMESIHADIPNANRALPDGGAVQHIAVNLTAFGELFAKACIPAVWEFPTVQRDDITV
ncbi:MAG: Abi-alpha family protein [Pseudomonadota bacterium]